MKAEAEREISYEEFYEDLFESAEAAEPNTEPGLPPKKLLGDIWYEGEMAVLYGETGTGKSVLATQIADSLARGKGFGPFEVEGGPRKVLYFDLKLDSRKWLMRYAEEPDENAARTKQKRHKFPKNFERVHIRTEMRLPKGHTSFTLPFARALRQYIKKKKPDVVIFDSLTRLKHSNDVTRDVLPVMRELSRLKHEMNISILVLAQSQQHHWTGSLQMSDLRGMRAVCNVADSVFAIAAGKFPGDCYVKQLRSYVSERLYDESHVPVFRLEKPDSESFLGLTFRYFAKEASARRGLRDLDRCPVMDEAKALRDKKLSLRAIASALRVSKTSVQRMLQQWTEPPDGPHAACLPVDAERPDDRSEPGVIATGFLDADEYNVDDAEPPLSGTHASRVPVVSDESAPDESYYDNDDQEYLRDVGLDDKPADTDEDDGLSAPGGAEPKEELIIENGELKIKEPDRDPQFSTISTQLTHTTDAYGKDVWVEEFYENGKWKVWYKYNRRSLRRYTRDGTGGISGEAVEIDSS
jgi:KaiC/GvpD/RAD55 family RecA-like ATPase